MGYYMHAWNVEYVSVVNIHHHRELLEEINQILEKWIIEVKRSRTFVQSMHAVRAETCMLYVCWKHTMRTK